MRFIITIVLVGLLYLVLRHFLRQFIRNLANNGAAGQQVPGRTGAPRPEENMVQCAHCGVYLPASEAITQQGQHWCSSEHARLGAK